MRNKEEKDVVVVEETKKVSKKNKDGKKVQKNRILEVLTKEYKYENLLLGTLAVIVAVISVYLISEELVFNGTIELIDGKEKTIGWILFAFSSVVVVSLLVPFFKPSIEELSKVQFPDKKELKTQSARVFTFMIFFAIIFLTLGILFEKTLVDWLGVLEN